MSLNTRVISRLKDLKAYTDAETHVRLFDYARNLFQNNTTIPVLSGIHIVRNKGPWDEAYTIFLCNGAMVRIAKNNINFREEKDADKYTYEYLYNNNFDGFELGPSAPDLLKLLEKPNCIV